MQQQLTYTVDDYMVNFLQITTACIEADAALTFCMRLGKHSEA